MLTMLYLRMIIIWVYSQNVPNPIAPSITRHAESACMPLPLVGDHPHRHVTPSLHLHSPLKKKQRPNWFFLCPRLSSSSGKASSWTVIPLKRFVYQTLAKTGVEPWQPAAHGVL